MSEFEIDELVEVSDNEDFKDCVEATFIIDLSKSAHYIGSLPILVHSKEARITLAYGYVRKVERKVAVWIDGEAHYVPKELTDSIKSGWPHE